MAWMEVISRSGITPTFKAISQTDQRMMLPSKPLPINILSVNQLEWALNNVILPGDNKEVLLIEGYYPPKFGHWATHKVFRINYRSHGQEDYLISKVMEKNLGNKEFTTLLNLKSLFNVPEPFYFMYDEQMAREFPHAGGILWMSYIKNIGHLEHCLVDYCSGEERDYKLKELTELLYSVWSTGVKHNDLKAHHLLFTGKEWFLIDFERSGRLFNEEDVKDELGTLIGDATLYLDRFIQYYRTEFVFIKERYHLFMTQLLKLFKVKDLLNNRLLSRFLQFIQNKELKSTLVGLLD